MEEVKTDVAVSLCVLSSHKLLFDQNGIAKIPTCIKCKTCSKPGVSKRRGLASPHRRTALENIPGFYQIQKVDVASIMTIMMSKY